jgi:cysteine synthase A
MIETARRMSEQPGHWWVNQINNQDAAAGYYSMGEEIWEQTGGNVDAYAHSVGSAHSLHGAAKALRRHSPRLHVAAVEPSESAVLSGKPAGSHKIEGIGIGFIPPHWKPEEVDEILTGSTEEAVQMCRRLAREEGVFAGVSSVSMLLQPFASQSVSAPTPRWSR